MTSSSSDGSRKRPRAASIGDDEASPTKRAASTEKSLNEPDGSGVMAGSEDPIDVYMRQQESPSHTQAPNKPIPPTPVPAPPPMPRVPRVSPREQWDAISRLKYTSQKEGDTWYVISSSWHTRWKNICAPNKYKADDSDLGPVDNSDIVDEQGRLFPALAEGEKYEVICKEAWDQFVGWYGEPNHTLARRIISEGEGKAKRVEVYPMTLYVYRMSKMTPASSNGATPQIVISKSAKVEELLNHVTQLSTLDRKDLRFWLLMGTSLEERPLEGTFYPSDRISLDSTQPFPAPEHEGKRIDEALVESGDAIVYEYCSQGVWTVDMGSLNITRTTKRATRSESSKPVFSPGSAEWNAKYGATTHNAIPPISTAAGPLSGPQTRAVSAYQGTSSTAFTFNGRTSSFTGPTRSPGTVGLNNLGNTCFMSSALQCLAHCPELTEYFLTGVYEDELNPTNPLGMKGAIAEVFGALLDRLWHPVSYAFAPREFKQQLQRFAPQFSGYAQHDTQEFLAFLLDGLHEDLNRVLKKPYVENPDWEGGGPKELVQHAVTSWEGYKKRNDSVIVDLFQGQYKSTLICPECEKVSITFDPFMYLTLPLPVQRTWEHTIHWVPYNILSPHQKIPVQLSRDASVKDLKVLLKKWMGTPVENQMAVEVFSHKIYKDFEDHSPVAEITDRDIIVFYELPCSSRQSQNSADDSCFAVPVYHASSSPNSTYAFHSSTDLFGIPLFVAIPADETNSEEAIYARLVERYSPWTQQPQELYKRRVVIPESSAASSGTSLSEDAQGADIEEKDVTEMNAEVDTDLDMLPDSRDPSVIGEEETITNLGPQENLFSIKVYAPSRAGGYSYSAGLLNDPLRGIGETLAERAAPKKKTTGWKWSRPSTPEPTTPGPKRPLINSEDTLLCEWDSNMLDFFFGITSKGFKKDENSLWEQWETYEHPEYVAAKQARKASKDRGITLEDCLDEFTKEEKLGEDDLWYCPRCKKHQQATKKFELWKVPDILVVHLKRFSNSRLLRDKIDSFVDFPIEALDLTSRVEERLVAKKWVEEGNSLEELGASNGISDEPLVYDLFAVDEHLGGLGGGHYRAYAHNFEDKTWYHFDDTHVTTSKARESVNSNAYLLFYRRRTNDPLGGATHEKVVAYNEKKKMEISPDTQDSEVEPNGAVVASSVRSLEPEYTSSFVVRSLSPDHSPPEHHDYYHHAFDDQGPILPELELDTVNPFGSSSPPDFADTFNDRILESSHDPLYPLTYGKHYRRNSTSSSNEAVSPASSFDDETRQDRWNDMEDIPDLEDVDVDADTYHRQRAVDGVKDEELDSDNLDQDPSLPATVPDPSVSPPLSPARESAPSPPGHEGPDATLTISNVDKPVPAP